MIFSVYLILFEYKSTIEKMLTKIKKQIYNINTDDLRHYLFEHKNERNSSKTTIDNIAIFIKIYLIFY